jgi:hypothetical protein
VEPPTFWISLAPDFRNATAANTREENREVYPKICILQILRERISISFEMGDQSTRAAAQQFWDVKDNEAKVPIWIDCDTGVLSEPCYKIALLTASRP